MEFQSKFTVVVPIYAKEPISFLLPQLDQKFQIVKRRWMLLVRHTFENTTMAKVLKFPSLVDTLVDNTTLLDPILDAPRPPNVLKHEMFLSKKAELALKYSGLISII